MAALKDTGDEPMEAIVKMNSFRASISDFRTSG
jgi:hypothetical protein